MGRSHEPTELKFKAPTPCAVKGKKMMYNEKLIASIKANGKILREFKENVLLPFGSEYSILLKNINTKRANINIFIDGNNIVPGGLVLNAGQEVDLERSIKSGNLHEGNKLKFIERTAGVESHRGVKMEDGLVRIEYQFEKIYKFSPSWLNSYDDKRKWFYQDHSYLASGSSLGGSAGDVFQPSYNSSGVLRSQGIINNVSANATLSSTADVSKSGADVKLTAKPTNSSQKMKSYVSNNIFPAANEVGITVSGSKSDQKFVTVNDFALEDEKFVIVLKLLGETADNRPIERPVTVKAKQTCDTCGHVNKMTAKFCNKCGTSLILFA